MLKNYLNSRLFEKEEAKYGFKEAKKKAMWKLWRNFKCTLVYGFNDGRMGLEWHRI